MDDDDEPYCDECGCFNCRCDRDDDYRTDHDRGVCMGPGCCEECDTPPPEYIREWRARKPQRGSRNARRRLQRTRDMQAQRRSDRSTWRARERYGCVECRSGGDPAACDCIPF